MATSNNGSVFNELFFEKKLSSLKDTQESIQGLSTWCLQHKIHYKQIIQSWLMAVKKSKPDQCLTLFYLANDIIQHSRKKGFQEIVTDWEPSLKEATPFVRDRKIRHRIERIFKIWEERDIYSSNVITELNLLLDKQTVVTDKSNVKNISDYEPVQLIEKIVHCKKLDEETDIKQKQLNESQVKITDVDVLRASLKERRKTNDFFQEFDRSVSRMEEYVKALETETQERMKLIGLLEQGDIFYEAQRGEAKVVCTAYKQFGSRIKGVKRKLEEMMSQLPSRIEQRASPLPTPDVNAPSPSSTGSDLELPDAFSSANSTDIGQQGQFTFSSAMDLDARITSFLAAGSRACSFLTTGRETSTGPTTQVSTTSPAASSTSISTSLDPFAAFYSPVNSTYNNFSSLLAAPPPPPPPPPPVLLPPPMFGELPKPDPPPMPPLSLMGHEPWTLNQSHHPLPSRIPSWGEEAINNGSSETADGLHAIQLASYYPSQDVDLRVNKRLIDHRNLISLTDGPGEKYTPSKGTAASGTAAAAAAAVDSRRKTSARDDEKSSWRRDVHKAKEGSLDQQSMTDADDMKDQMKSLFEADRHGFLPIPRLGEEDRSSKASGSSMPKASDAYSSRLPYSHGSSVPKSGAHQQRHHRNASPARYSRPPHSSYGSQW